MPKQEVQVKPTPSVAAKRVSKPASKAKAKPASKVAVKPVKHQKASTKGDATKALKETPKSKKIKVIRDSFTMPEPEYELIAAIKKRCIAKGIAVKKSEVLRAAISSFASQNDALIIKSVMALAAIKTGRPPKGKK
jgi:hypothetical protein